MRSLLLKPGFLFYFLSMCFASRAFAGWEIIPETRHQLFQSYSFFIEQNSAILYRGASRYWASVAATIPLAGNDDSDAHPQVLFHFSGNDSMHLDPQGGVYTESLDTRIGLMYETALPWWELRFSGGFFHESGHVVDGVSDPDLIPTNLGLNVIRLRLLRDFDRRVRVGLTVDPIVHSIPDTVATGMNEFFEYFPWGSYEAERKGAFYISGGVAHSLSFDVKPTLNLQAGLSFGSHFQLQHLHSARIVLGYYSGSDPRAKYAEFFAARSEFGYLGLMFDL